MTHSSLIHYTLNTGHSRQSERSEVADSVIRHLSPLLEPGTHQMPAPPGYRLRVSLVHRALMATLLLGTDKDERPCVTLAVAPDDETAEPLWPYVERHYHQITELPGIRAADFAAAHQPAKTPWCAAVLIAATPAEARWIADFERCIAWAWIERCRGTGE